MAQAKVQRPRGTARHESADRKALRAAMQRAIATHAQHPFVVLALGLDRFDDVNSTFGFDRGDQALDDVEDRLSEAFAAIGRAAHIGSDEFVLWVQTGSGTLDEALDRLRSAFRQPFEIGGEPVLLGASVGASVYPRHGADAETLLRRAHLAMRIAKREDASFAVYRPEVDEPSVSNVQRLRELRDAIDRNALALYYQPKVDVATGAVTGCEALLRWPQGDQTLLPADFLPLCERTGLMRPLDRWVLAAAARQFAAWQSEGLRMPLSVNISARSFDEERLPGAVFAAMDLWGIAGHEFELEVTETAVMANPERAVRVAQRLAAMGVSVAIDDFGSGNCPFVYLSNFHAGSIKIASTFVQGIVTRPASAAIVQTLIDLGRRLGRHVIAEGAEDQATLDCLRDMACPEVQGFHIARPMPGPEFVAWLRSSGRPQWPGRSE